MSKIYVKLKDRGSIFHDASQEATVTGAKVVAVKKTGKVASALRNSLLVQVEAPKEESKPEEPKKPATGDSKPDYDKLKKSELIELLSARNIEHDKEATNAVLAGLLKADDEANAGA